MSPQGGPVGEWDPEKDGYLPIPDRPCCRRRDEPIDWKRIDRAARRGLIREIGRNLWQLLARLIGRERS